MALPPGPKNYEKDSWLNRKQTNVTEGGKTFDITETGIGTDLLPGGQQLSSEWIINKMYIFLLKCNVARIARVLSINVSQLSTCPGYNYSTAGILLRVPPDAVL